MYPGKSNMQKIGGKKKRIHPPKKNSPGRERKGEKNNSMGPGREWEDSECFQNPVFRVNFKSKRLKKEELTRP